jgi:inosine-uridine nucleoside N-ribohydrolase
MLKLHLDTDLGGDLDDLCALAMLLRWPHVELTGITTTAEARGRRAGYVHYVLRLAGRSEIPVAAGADATTAMGYRSSLNYHPDAVLWPEPISPAPTPLDDALGLMKTSIEAGAILVGIGPCTNFRLLDQRYPGLLSQARLVLMGGYPFPPRARFPRWGPNMDFNVQIDPGSSHHVLTRTSPLLVPLAVTVETALRQADLEPLRQAGPLGQLIAHQASRWLELEPQNAMLASSSPGLPADFINFQHDPLACAVAGGWTGITTESMALTVEHQDSWLVERRDPLGTPFRVVTAVQTEAFHAFWLDLVAQP